LSLFSKMKVGLNRDVRSLVTCYGTNYHFAEE
jgi:hypothetical protein